jgi:hypothetical protein
MKCSFCNNEKVASLLVVYGGSIETRYFCLEHLRNKPSKIEEAFHVLKEKDKDIQYYEFGKTDEKEDLTTEINSLKDLLSFIKKTRSGEGSVP